MKTPLHLQTVHLRSDTRDSYVESFFSYFLSLGHMNYSYEIVESRYGLFTSVFKDGTKGTTALTREACDFVTKNIRIPVMRGEWDGPTSIMGSAVVGGKL